MKIRAAISLFCISSIAEAGSIRFGVQLAPDVPYEEIVETFRLVEDLGYDTVWLNDHFMPYLGDPDAPQLEAWTLLAALATQTKRIRLGILVSGNTYRHPAVLAKMAATVDHVSAGRLEFGIGAGWQENEHRAYGIPFFTARERAERLGEALEVITRLWRDQRPTFDGRFYDLHDAPFSPKPLQKPHPPIVVGGQGEKWIMPLVARYADQWNAPIGVSPEETKTRLDLVRSECRRIERSPCVPDVSVFLALANLTNVPLAGPATRLGARLIYGKKIAGSVLAGSVEGIRAKIQEYQNAGVTSVIITTRPGLNRDLIRRFAEEVVPGFRPAAGN